MIVKIPLDMREEFYRNPEKFMRDYANIPMRAVSPFFRNKSKVMSVVDFSRTNPFDEKNIRFFDQDLVCRLNPHKLRFLHIDLAVKHDGAGISMAHCSEFVDRREYNAVRKEYIVSKGPFVYFDFIGRITAQRGADIDLSAIEFFIMDLRRRGFPIGLITFDQYQSTQMIQNLERVGFTCARLSVDRTTTKVLLDQGKPEGYKKVSTSNQFLAAMQCWKDLVYESRASIPFHPEYRVEMESAEQVNDKIQYPVHCHDDLIQTLAGTSFNVVNNSFYYPEVNPALQQQMEDPFHSRIQAARTRSAPWVDTRPQQAADVSDPFYRDAAYRSPQGIGTMDFWDGRSFDGRPLNERNR